MISIYLVEFSLYVGSYGIRSYHICNVNDIKKRKRDKFDSFPIYKQGAKSSAYIAEECIFFVDTLKRMENLLSPNWYKSYIKPHC